MAPYDRNKVIQDFPPFAFLVDDPEVGDIFRRFYEQDKHLQGQAGMNWFESQIFQTRWWRTRSANARDIAVLQQTDPAEYSRQLDLSRARVQALLTNLGAWVPPDRQDWIAQRAVAENLSDFEIRWMITSGEWKTGVASPVAAQVRSAFAKYLVPFNQELNNAAVGNIINEQWTVQNLEEALRTQAKFLYPHLTSQLDSGMDMRQITDPYRSLLASTLEVSPEQIDFLNPKYRAAIDFIDERGEHRLMSLTEAERFAMSLPDYRATRGAREKSAEVGQVLARELGKAPV